MQQLASGIDARLKLAACIAAGTAVIGAAPAAVQAYIGPTASNAFSVTLRWALIAGFVHTLRKAARARVHTR